MSKRKGKLKYPKKSHPAWNKGMKMENVPAKIKRTQFKSGHRPANSLSVGSVRKRQGGRWYIKVSDAPGLTQTQRWVSLARYIYEKAHHRKLKKSERIVFLNGNHDDLSLDNLACVTGAEQAAMTQKDLYTSNKRLTSLGVMTAKVLSRVKDRQGSYDD